MPSPPALAYYVTAHGFGHGTRSCDVLAALARMRPDVDLVVVTDLAGGFLRSRLPFGNVSIRPGRFDVGMVQRDSLHVDLEATLAEGDRFLARASALLDAEESFLRDRGIVAVVADIPGIPLVAAANVGLPSIAVGNFGWDHIYEEYAEADPRWEPLVAHFREGYARADVLLRLPFAEPMRAFRAHVNLPLVATKGTNRRSELAERYGIPRDSVWALVSLASIEWDARAIEKIESMRGIELLSLPPLQLPSARVKVLDRAVVPYSDLLASCDVVVTKPGYGVVSECAVNDKPIVWSPRDAFREQPILVAALERSLRAVMLPTNELYAGEIEGAIREATRAERRGPPLPSGGDVVAAHEILTRAGL
jgi:hypothetical protein